MSAPRKITYEQAEALERGQATMRRNRRERAAQSEQTEPMSSERKAEWEAQRKAAVAAYRARKNA